VRHSVEQIHGAWTRALGEGAGGGGGVDVVVLLVP
jgi:hypothetical protein